MSESYFTKVANEVLDASEKLAYRLEEGLNLFLGGEVDGASSSGSASKPHQGAASDNEFEGWEDDMDGMDAGSPLDGIAQSVMGDIMAGQVSSFFPWYSC